jgi:hypothetical protein
MQTSKKGTIFCSKLYFLGRVLDVTRWRKVPSAKCNTEYVYYDRLKNGPPWLAALLSFQSYMGGSAENTLAESINIIIMNECYYSNVYGI